MDEPINRKTLAFLLTMSIFVSLGGIFVLIKSTPTITGAAVTSNIPSIDFLSASQSTIFILVIFALTFIFMYAKRN